MESSDPEYTCKNDNSTQEEGEAQPDPPVHWELKLPYYWHWHDHDYAVGDYVDYRGADTQTFEVDTVAGLVLVPNEAERSTLEDDTKCHSKVPAGDEPSHTPDGDPEIKVRVESSVIKYEN